MSGDDPGQTQFLEEVFPEEIDYIAKRRMAMANGRPDVGTPTKLPHQPLEETPNAERNGLVGLAFSGGGIRSATFNLGVLQVLHKRRIFERVDLLSTVSGGGFIGSSLTSLMNRRNSFPFRDRGAVETDEVTHLRNLELSGPRGVPRLCQDVRRSASRDHSQFHSAGPNSPGTQLAGHRVPW